MKRYVTDRAGRRLHPLPLALALLTAAAPAIAQTPAASAAPPRIEEEICERVRIDEDRLHGIRADETLVCRDKSDVERPLLKGTPDWGVYMQVDYALVEGTKVRYLYDRPAGNCVRDWRDWEETAGGGDYGSRLMFTAVAGSMWDSCAYERSYGSWNITATAPDGATGSVNIRIMTGSANAGAHYAEVQCHFAKDLACVGGSDIQIAKLGKKVTPRLRLGPLTSAPPPAKHRLRCTHSVYMVAGESIHEEPTCTTEGFPHPEVRVDGLPAGLTLTRAAPPLDDRLVLSGRVDRHFRGQVTVTVLLPGGLIERRSFQLDVD
jgi:hypothetical protein